MRGFLEVLSIFDWITPLKGFVEDIINDPTPLQSNSWTFFISFDQAINAGWSLAGIESLLRKHGVKTWGGQMTNGEYFFSVKLDQAHWAEYLMLRYGVPLNERFLPPGVK